MARSALSARLTALAVLAVPAAMLPAQAAMATATRPGDPAAHTAGTTRHPGAAMRACSLKADQPIRKGQKVEAIATGMTPKKSAQLWIEGQKVASPQHIGKHGRVHMYFTVSQPPGHHPVWITDGAQRCDIPGGITVRR